MIQLPVLLGLLALAVHDADAASANDTCEEIESAISQASEVVYPCKLY
jgi:hypothetical protein